MSDSVVRHVCAVIALALLVACRGSGAGVDLRPVPMPDLSRSDAPVQAQVRAQHALVMDKLASGAPAPDRGAAYGELAMLFHAAEYFDAAEPAYLNARALAPQSLQWPYYLGHLYRRVGKHEEAIESFRRALELRPSDVPALVWLARTYLDLGRPGDAEPLLDKAHSLASRNVAVLAARGQAALARGEHSQAASLLEEALTVDPRAASLHAPLAAAYRALGQGERAGRHLAQWIDVEVPLQDPLSEQLATVLRSAVSYELRGVRQFDAGNWKEAAAIFRQGLELTAPETPVGRSLRHKLGIALHLDGDVSGALEQFTEATRLAPPGGHDEPASRAHYSLGIIMASAGRTAGAIDHFSRAVEYDPKSVPARLALGDALRRSGHDEASLAHYQEAIAINPQAADARFGHALALVRLRRWVDARRSLEEAVVAQPDRPELSHALARVLAAAPDPRARDGYRAALLVDELFKTSRRVEVGETMAMALAELGDYDKAAAIQRGVIDAARRAGLAEVVRRMAANLSRYERRQPSRTPWAPDDPLFQPGPPVSPALEAVTTR